MKSHLIAALAVASFAPAVGAQIPDLDQEPLRYKHATADNPVSRLEERLRAGKAKLTQTDDHGYLKSLLKELDIPVSSQVLVFSKTSFQRERISPKTPRALYFNDDVYVGFCWRGDVLEVSAADPTLGTAFYTLDQNPDEPVRFVRQTDNCTICHASSRNQGYPGHLLRSVYADREGFPILSSGSHNTDHASPLAERWGGWYVTGTHGKQTHLGNFVAANKRKPEDEANDAGQNVTSLRERFTVANYLSPHSDLVALMVLEHQVEMHNRLARADMLTRQALHQEVTLNRELGEPAGKRWDSTTRRVVAAGEPVVEYLFFSGEAKLTDPVKGTSTFADEFAARGPFDAKGRSLRQFDLTTRLFKHPFSYLAHSTAFRKLPGEVRTYIWKRVREVLDGTDTSDKFAHLTPADRAAIRDILRATVPEFGK